jgi:hypothetical protein
MCEHRKLTASVDVPPPLVDAPDDNCCVRATSARSASMRSWSRAASSCGDDDGDCW